MNFTYVRICSIALAMLVAGLGTAPFARGDDAGAPERAGAAAEPGTGERQRSAAGRSPQAGGPRAIVAVMPSTFWLPVLEDYPALSPGVMSTGVGTTSPLQTYLDITQGNRLSETLYPGPLPDITPRAGRIPPAQWRRAIERAADAPAQLVPGSLAGALERSGVPVRVERGLGAPTLLGANERGQIRSVLPEHCGRRGCGPGLSIIRGRPAQLPGVIRSLRGDDLLIALRELPAYRVSLVTIGIAGSGFDGNLTSSSTRTDGIVISSDLAPTLLERLGVAVPEEMNGHAIRSEAPRELEAVERLEERLTSRPSRTVAVLIPLEVWLALAILATLLFRAAGARRALPLLALACVWGPALLLLGAAIQPGEAAEAAIFAVGAPALGAIALSIAPAYAALAASCAIVVGIHAVDVVTGSPLTALSVLGPNPGGGVRFFGIGNELGASLAVLVLVGTGAGLAALGVRSPRRVAAVFLGAVAIAAIAFAPGRFGADVGSAIMLGAGGGVAAGLALGLGWRGIVVVLAGGAVVALGALVAIDALAGGAAHLSGSILGADSSEALSDSLERRIRLTARSFVHPAYPELFGIVLALLAVGVWQRRAVLAWFGEGRQARFGYFGALAGILVGTLANDSGTLLLTVGGIYLIVFAGFFWAIRDPQQRRSALSSSIARSRAGQSQRTEGSTSP